MLVLWDFILAGLVVAFFAGLAWLLLSPPHDSWVPTEFLEEDEPDDSGPPTQVSQGWW